MWFSCFECSHMAVRIREIFRNIFEKKLPSNKFSQELIDSQATKIKGARTIYSTSVDCRASSVKAWFHAARGSTIQGQIIGRAKVSLSKVFRMIFSFGWLFYHTKFYTTPSTLCIFCLNGKLIYAWEPINYVQIYICLYLLKKRAMILDICLVITTNLILFDIIVKRYQRTKIRNSFFKVLSFWFARTMYIRAIFAHFVSCKYINVCICNSLLVILRSKGRVYIYRLIDIIEWYREREKEGMSTLNSVEYRM